MDTLTYSALAVAHFLWKTLRNEQILQISHFLSKFVVSENVVL